MNISTPCTIATLQNFILKFDTRDYVRDMTPHAILGADRMLERQTIATDFLVCLLVCHAAYPALMYKMAEQIEVPFGLKTFGGGTNRNIVFRSEGEGSTFNTAFAKWF